MAHIIKKLMKTSKIKTVIAIALPLAMLIAVFARYHRPVDIEQVCITAAPTLVHNIKSCSSVDEILGTLAVGGYKPITLEDSKQGAGLLRPRFDRQILEVSSYRVDEDSGLGIAQFRFINGRLSSLFYFPQASDKILQRYPEMESAEVTVKHLTNYQGLKYISWSSNYLETYIAWWISRFS